MKMSLPGVGRCPDLRSPDLRGSTVYTINGELIHKIVCKDYPRGIAVDNNNNIICVCSDSVVYIY